MSLGIFQIMSFVLPFWRNQIQRNVVADAVLGRAR